MISHASPDEVLLGKLPLPLAQLYRRAHNAKTALERHLTAFYLWEAALKLLASAAVVEYAGRDAHDAQLAERLQNLARPALGHWWEFARRLVPVLADQDDAFRSVRDLLLGKPRSDLPRTSGLDAALREALGGSRGNPAVVAVGEMFDRLVRLRNEEVGHGAAGQRSGDYYERMGAALLAGVGELLARFDVLAGRRLLYVADVRRLASGAWLVERYELSGESSRRLESLEAAESEAARLPRPGRLYLAAADADIATWRLLHPLVLFDAEASRVFFLNSRKGERRADYLCYTSGEVVKRDELGQERRELLARVLGASVDEAEVAAFEANGKAEEPPAPDPAPGRRTLGEFELISRLGRGGMGVVYRAWQSSLGRQVALKCLLRSGDPKAEARFAREIHALGKVEHPHLVKVFTSGTDGDQWFYAMELVEGADLGAVIDQLAGSTAADLADDSWTTALSNAWEQQKQKEEAVGGPPDAAPPVVVSTPAEPPRGGTAGHVAQVVEIVRQAAEAAHALHEAGVVHRDIKPGNILLTSDGGHAVLMDLGLAQLTDETEGRLTRTRQFVGTLRYASPEQVLAAGKLDRRADVYSLGATLWELLTLRPLFGATEQTPTPDLMLAIQSKEPEYARRFNRRVPADLQAIVLKCLEKDRSRRYATAAELAEDLARWQRGDPVLAQPPCLRYLVTKYGWQYRRSLGLAAGVLLAAVVGVALAFWQISAAYEDEKSAKQAVEREKQNVVDEQQKTAAALDKSREAEKLSLATVSGVVSDIHAQLKDKPALRELRKKLLKTAEDGLNKVARNAETAGVIDHAAVWLHIKLGDIFLDLDGATADALKQYQLAHALAKKLAAAYPGSAEAKRDLAVSFDKVGDAQMQSGDTKAVLDSYQQSLAIAKELAAVDLDSAQAQRDLAVSFNKMGDAQMWSGDTKSARESYQQSLAIAKKLAASDPGTPQAQRDLAVTLDRVGDVQMQSGDTKAALASYQQSLAIAKELAAVDLDSAQAQRDLALSFNKIGDAQVKSVDTKAALASYQLSLDLRKKLAVADRGSAQAQRDVAVSFNKMGDVQMQSGDTKAALASYQQSLAIAKELAAADPGSAQAQSDMSISLNNRGDAQLRSGDTKAALASYQQSLAIDRKLAAADPGSAQAQRDVSVSLDRVGNAQMTSGDTKAAVANYQESLAVRNKLAAADPASAQAQRDLFVSFEKMGNAHLKSGDTNAALESYQLSLDIRKKLAAADKGSVQAQRDLSNGLYIAACGYAIASTKPETDNRSKDAHAAEAVALLREARDKGFFENKVYIELMKHHANLDPLRQRDDFKALLADLEKDAK